jgi:glycosyltransferase involved in cell wall biosynthesis
VVVCHECWPHALFAPRTRRAGLPLVFAAHGTHDGRHWSERLARMTPPDLVLTASDTVRATMTALYPGVRAEMVRLPVAPAQVNDRPGARRRLRGELGTPADAVVILMACRMEAWKGHAALLGALGRLADVPHWECWIAGGAQRPEERRYLAGLLEMAEAPGLAGRVRFLGQRADVPELMAAADVSCQPNTHPEPFGIAFVEALYAGLPVASTSVGGAAEVVDGTCGVLVPPGDVAALAAALRRLLADADLRERLGHGGPARARALCEPAARLGELGAALAGLAGGRGAEVA